MEQEVTCDHCNSRDVISAFDLVRDSRPVELYWCPSCGMKTTVSDVPED